MRTDVPIGEAARQTGIKVPTIRYYEEIGLLDPPVRTESNRRLYGTDALQRLAFIRHARELGFALDAVRQLLDMADDPARSCRSADSIATRHLAEIETKIARLTALRDEIARMTACPQDRVADCRVIEVLSDHSACLHKVH